MVKKIKSIILEEIKNYTLNEFHQYQDDEVVLYDNINLQREFDKINSEVFSNEVPKIPLIWVKSKRHLGRVKTLKNRATRDQKLVNLGISTFFEVPYVVFKSVLAHEMIHVKLVHEKDDGHYWNPHGRSFEREMNRINNMGLGYKISEKNYEDFGVSAAMKAQKKRLIGIIIEIDGKYYIAVTTPKIYEEQFQHVESLWRNLVRKGKYNNVELTVVETTNAELLKFSLKRSFLRGISYSPLDDNLLNDLLDDNIIKSIKFDQKSTSVNEEEMGDYEIVYIT